MQRFDLPICAYLIILILCGGTFMGHRYFYMETAPLLFIVIYHFLGIIVPGSICEKAITGNAVTNVRGGVMT